VALPNSMQICRQQVFLLACLLWLSLRASAEQVSMPSFNLNICGVKTTRQADKTLALRQYLSHFSRPDLYDKSLEPILDFQGNPCIRPVVQNTSLSLANRIVELGYAEWDSRTGLLDIDLWMASYIQSQMNLVPETKAAKQQPSTKVDYKSDFAFPWIPVFVILSSLTFIVLLSLLSRLSAILTRRVSVASLSTDGRRLKVRGIVIPLLEPLQLPNTDIKAIAFSRVAHKYGHKGWKVIEAMTERVPCSLDDGTASTNIEITHANVHFTHRITVYNGIPGDVSGRSPYVDDVKVTYKYIPVGAIITLVGSFVPWADGFRALKNVHVFEGDERAEVRKIKSRVVLSLGVLLALVGLVLALRLSK
jgi:hypothetical protein